MREVIKSLVRFFEEQEIDPLFEDAVRQYSREDVRFFSGEILSWLRSDLLVSRKKGVKYYDRPAWFLGFSQFIQNMEELNALFSCTDYSIDFREEIPFDERMEIHQYVAENLKPPRMFVTYR
jgi:hypothetical protein